MSWLGPAHPFYKPVNELLEAEQFDEFAEKECARFYAGNNGRPSLTPGIYFRLLLVGYLKGSIRSAGSPGERRIRKCPFSPSWHFRMAYEARPLIYTLSDETATRS